MRHSRQVLRRNPNFVHRRIEGETLLVPIRSNVGDLDHIYSLNEVGAFVWNAFDGSRDLATIKTLMASEFEVADGEAEADLLDFVAELEEIGAALPVAR